MRDPAVVEQWIERVRAAAAQGGSLCLHGGCTKAFYGGEPRGEPLDARAANGIVQYEPSELVVTVRGGTPLEELETALRENGQMLPFEPPHFARGAARATVGGCVAAGLSGPRRMSVGALRDFVLGVKLIDGRARLLRFGGEVMKNVAGYDVSRLIAGSLGTLGIIVEVSFKVLPRPATETTLRFEFPEAAAIETLNRWMARSLPISASAWRDGQLSLRLSGAEPAVQAGLAKLGGERLAPGEAQAFWHGLREHTDMFYDPDVPLWRLALPSNADPVALSGGQLIEWGGALRWWQTLADADHVRAAAERVGGHATLFRSPGPRGDAFAPLSPIQARLHHGLKNAFDPGGVFNRGRLYAAF